MKRTIQILLLLVGLTSMSYAQKNHAVNVQVSADESKVTLQFDLPPNGTHRAFEVSINTSNPTIKPRTVQGTGTVIADTELSIDWYYTADGYTQTDLEGVKINVMAIDPLEPTQRKVTTGPKTRRTVAPWAGLSTLGVTAIGLITSGAVTEGNAMDDYGIYKDNLSEVSSVYEDLGITREELYTQANGKHKRAQAMIYGGGVVLVAGVVILIKRLSVQSKIKNGGYGYNRWDVQPVLSPAAVAPQSKSSGSVGLQIGWKF